MKFRYRYFGSTTVDASDSAQSFSFAPDTLRPPTAFHGELRAGAAAQHLAFREAMSALHGVVVSDLRPRGRDAAAYRQWLDANESSLLAQFMQRSQQARTELDGATAELQQLRSRKSALLAPFHRARQRYFDWLYQNNREAWYVLDPVITVHPQRLLFEAFSQDESSYCAVSVGHDLFTPLDTMACGTTNIDYSIGLYDEFQKIRDYKRTVLRVDPSGFGVTNADDPEFREEKIDLPDSWVRGFLQVSSAMTLPATLLELHPMDLHNLCATLRQHKERAGPRSLRFDLQPGQPATLVFEPWGIAIPARRSAVVGAPLAEPRSVRVWGRRRLLMLERLIALATRVRVHLLGSGMPSFWVIEMGEVSVTLGLSGWTANDWSAAGRFDLLQPRQAVSEVTLNAVAAALQSSWVATAAELAARTALPPADVLAALTLWVQAGRAVFDLPGQRYAWRELSREPLPLESLRFASPEESRALALVQARGVRLKSIAPEGEGLRIRGAVIEARREYEPVLLLNADEQLADGQCSCNFFQQNRMRRGPCAHQLALRRLAQPQLDRARGEAAAKEAA